MPGETVWKIERGSWVTYAPEHEKELPNRSYRRRMGGPRAPRSGSQKAGTSQASQLKSDPRRRLLRPEERLPLAALASGLPALGGPSTGGLVDGERTEPSSGSTPPCASVYGPAWAGTHYLARASPIHKRPRVPGWAGSREVTMATRRSGAESDTCSWTRRAWCSKPRYTARRCRTRMG